MKFEYVVCFCMVLVVACRMFVVMPVKNGRCQKSNFTHPHKKNGTGGNNLSVQLRGAAAPLGPPAVFFSFSFYYFQKSKGRYQKILLYHGCQWDNTDIPLFAVLIYPLGLTPSRVYQNSSQWYIGVIPLAAVV